MGDGLKMIDCHQDESAVMLCHVALWWTKGIDNKVDRHIRGRLLSNRKPQDPFYESDAS